MYMREPCSSLIIFSFTFLFSFSPSLSPLSISFSLSLSFSTRGFSVFSRNFPVLLFLFLSLAESRTSNLVRSRRYIVSHSPFSSEIKEHRLEYRIIITMNLVVAFWLGSFGATNEHVLDTALDPGKIKGKKKKRDDFYVRHKRQNTCTHIKL